MSLQEQVYPYGTDGKSLNIQLSQVFSPAEPRRTAIKWTALLAVAAISTLLTSTAYALSKEKQAAAMILFHKTGCEYCHGVNGMGSEKAPDLSAVGKRRKREQIEQQILKGGNGMPAFGEILPTDDVKTLVDYLSARKKAGR